MNYVILDGGEMATKEIAHTYLVAKLQLPDYYGRNLDALWDLLSTMSEPIKIILINEEKLMGYLGDYGSSLVEVLCDAAEENENISFEMTKGRCDG